jgi:CubicO group peptidase (beta-lactamase class C family)
MIKARIELGITSLVLAAILAACLTPAAQPQPNYWPTDGWRSAAPEEQGMNSEILLKMIEAIKEEQLPLHSLLIVRNGYLVGEIYPYPYTADQVHIVQSVTKSVIGALTGIAIEQGKIKDVDEPLLSSFPEENVLNPDEKKTAITMENLLSLTAGLDCPEDPSLGKPIMQTSGNWVGFMLDQPMVSRPGEKFNYCTGEAHLLSAILQKATGMSTRTYANQMLFSPIGIKPLLEARWPSDPQGVTLGGYGLGLTPQEMAKFGYLFLNKGKWDGTMVLPSQWVKTSTTRHNQGDGKKDYGYLWWIDPQGKWYAALGRNGQHIFVYPTENMVVVFTAALPTGDDADLIPLQKLLDQYILPAVKSDRALPANPDAQARFKAAVQAMAQPQPSIPASLPAIAREISGKNFALDDNPFGWHTIAFSFKEGETEAKLNVDGMEIAFGLDNVYRFVPAGDSPFPQGFRGSWEGGDTFNVESIQLGTPTYFKSKVLFFADGIHIIQRDELSGSEVDIQGRLIDEG